MRWLSISCCALAFICCWLHFPNFLHCSSHCCISLTAFPEISTLFQSLLCIPWMFYLLIREGCDSLDVRGFTSHHTTRCCCPLLQYIYMNTFPCFSVDNSFLKFVWAILIHPGYIFFWRSIIKSQKWNVYRLQHSKNLKYFTAKEKESWILWRTLSCKINLFMKS